MSQAGENASPVASVQKPPVVEFRHVGKTFDPGTPRQCVALEELDFSIEDTPGRGEFIAIVGPSGCGKSTMLNLLAGFKEVYPPSCGEILVHGRPICGPGIDRGMIFQKYSSFPQMTVLRNVCFGLEINRRKLGTDQKEIVSQARQWIERVGLGGHENKYPHQLSGGQQQRVAIARSLILKPQIILMDEPFSALDEPTRLEMQKLLVDLWQEIAATVFIVTHSLVEAVYFGDRVWVFRRNPGSIQKEFRDIPPAVPGMAPLEVQRSPQFLAMVERVAAEFRTTLDHQQVCA
ncbi:MAG: ABC transporter ATP-binding protein [Candidatus Aminicenantes bacterium]|nr:ABC transporter ATP-binding protein [Candidatus Aminicenantes bacterium]